MSTSKKQIITIAGRPGSGKSSTAKAVAAHLGFTHFSSGDLFRELSKQQGINILQLNLAAEQESGIPTSDAILDQRLRDIGQTESKIVIDSRTAWHWIPDSFKVLLNLDLLTAANRILANMSQERAEVEDIPDDPKEYARVMEERLASESRRYKKLYNIDPYDTSNYDLVIDTSKYNLEATIEEVIARYSGWIKS